MIRSNSVLTGHPRVTIENRSDGAIIVHDRRGSPEEVRRNRVWISAAGLAGMTAIGLSVLRLQRLERLDTLNAGIALLVAISLALFTGFAAYFGRGWEEIEVTFNNLQVRALPLDLGRGRVVHRSQVDHVRVEKDKDGFRDRFRVQLAGPQGQGLLPSYGALSGIPTQDEAAALAGAIARQFELPFTPGVQPEAARVTLLGKWSGQEAERARLEAGPYLPLRQRKGRTWGRIRVRQSNFGPIVTYYNTIEAASLLLFGSFCFGFLVLFARDSLGSASIPTNVRLFFLVFVLPFSLAGFYLMARVVGHSELYLHGQQLIRSFHLGPRAIIKKEVPLADVQRVATAVAWDSYDNMHHHVVAQLKNGNELIIINKLPEDDGHALVWALHEHLGLPVI